TLEGGTGCGLTAILAAALASATRCGLAAAIHDGTLYPPDLERAGVVLERLLLVSAASPLASARCADILLRSRAFSLVTLPAVHVRATVWSRLCALVAAFRLAVARRGIDTPGESFLLADKADRGRVLEVDDRAHALGARAGQTVLQACVASAGARVLVHDAPYAQSVWEDMLDELDALSPLVDDAAQGTAYVEMRGCD